MLCLLSIDVTENFKTVLKHLTDATETTDIQQSVIYKTERLD